MEKVGKAMTAEEKLKELYKELSREMTDYGNGTIAIKQCGMLICPEHIDLIADLVMERLNKRMTSPVKIRFGEEEA